MGGKLSGAGAVDVIVTGADVAVALLRSVAFAVMTWTPAAKVRVNVYGAVVVVATSELPSKNSTLVIATDPVAVAVTATGDVEETLIEVDGLVMATVNGTRTEDVIVTGEEVAVALFTSVALAVIT